MMKIDVPELLNDINKRNFNKIINEFMLYKDVLRLEEASPDTITFLNINTKSRTMAQVPTLEDRIKERINILTDELETQEDFIKKLNLRDEEELAIFASESKEIYEKRIVVDEYTKLLNDEI